ERDDAGDAPPGAHDHASADLLAQDPVWRANVLAPFRGDRRGLQAEPTLADRLRGLVDDPVVGRAARVEREVEAGELQLEPGDPGCENAQRLFEQLLPRLVSFEDDDR